MKKIFAVFSLFLTHSLFYALDVPAPAAHINDYAGIMRQSDKIETEQYLSSLEASTGIQIAVLTIRSLKGEDLEAFSYEVAQKWQLGQKEKDNGALLLVAVEERKVRIETGYGLEDKLTDMKSGLIIRNVILPEFRSGNYSEGILQGVKNMGGIASGNAELVSENVLSSDKSDGAESVLFGLLFVFGWFILFSCLASGRRNHWLPWIIFSSAFRNQYRNSGLYGTHSRNNGTKGGGFGSSGGFHGGGGSFGGGGASGGW